MLNRVRLAVNIAGRKAWEPTARGVVHVPRCMYAIRCEHVRFIDVSTRVDLRVWARRRSVPYALCDYCIGTWSRPRSGARFYAYLGGSG